MMVKAIWLILMIVIDYLENESTDYRSLVPRPGAANNWLSLSRAQAWRGQQLNQKAREKKPKWRTLGGKNGWQ